ncbi:MAG: aspartate/glutamate racemase family protein [Hyphomicrobiaceae bacterium]
MADRLSQHFGLIGGLGVGASVIYYEAIAAACASRGIIPRLTMAHANAPTALALVTAGRIEEMAQYLAGFVRELSAAGADFFAIPAITPHICLPELQKRVSLPIVDILDVSATTLRQRSLARVSLFGTRFTIDTALFGALDGVDVVRPTDAEVDEIHATYLDLATSGQTTPEKTDRLRRIADRLCRDEKVEAVLLAGTDLNLVFDEKNAGFPAVDCASAHIAAIVARMAAA